MPRVSCPGCGLAGELPAALLGGEPRPLTCPRCGRRFPAEVALAGTVASSGAGPAPAWRPVAGWQVAALAAACLLLWTSIWRRGWLFAVVSGADLVFHEAGHPLFGIFGWPLLGYLGGALGQLAFPAAAAAVFAARRLAPSFAATVVWLGFNLLDVGRYAADGDARALPLLTGDPGSHDWWNVLGILGLRGRAGLVGGVLQALGWATMAAAPAWLAWRWRRSARAGEAAPDHPW